MHLRKAIRLILFPSPSSHHCRSHQHHLYPFNRIGSSSWINTMASSTISLTNLLQVAVASSERAGFIVKEIMKSGELGTVDKGIEDFQTEADRSAQRCIVQTLAHAFPGLTIIGEEGPEDTSSTQEGAFFKDGDGTSSLPLPPSSLFPNEVPLGEVVVWVDPLDGTREYTQGLLDHVTVLIGISFKGKAVAGVVHQPYFNYKSLVGQTVGRTVYGLVGSGVQGMAIRNIDCDKTETAKGLVITTTRSHSNSDIIDSLEALKPREVIRVGGAGHKVLLVIEGEADAYVFPSGGCKKWDTCGPEAVLRAMGGKLTDIHGQDIEYHATVAHPNSGGVLATLQPQLIDLIVPLIPQHVKDKLNSKL